VKLLVLAVFVMGFALLLALPGTVEGQKGAPDASAFGANDIASFPVDPEAPAAGKFQLASGGQITSAGETEAPTADMDRIAFDDNLLHNGFTLFGNPVVGEPVPNRSFRDNKAIFEEQETIADGIGPTYNAQSCAECHQNPTTGGISQVTELRAGHLNSSGVFIEAPGGSLIHSRATGASIAEFVPDSENIRTFRTSLNTLGDGFVECIANSTLLSIRDSQPSGQRGTAISVPVVEANGVLRIGRFGWKAQHASLLSFSGDAYLNEMGITSKFQSVDAFRDPRAIVENTSLGVVIPPQFDGHPTEPEDEGEDVEAFANFMRATRAPGRAENNGGPNAAAGETLFNQIGCAVCHVSTITTADPGTLINGGAFTVPVELGNKIIHPFSDFLLHDVGTGDGIVQNGGQGTRNMLRTPPLWGVRTRNRLMHDGASLTFNDAIQRHGGQATSARNAFNGLSSTQKSQVIAFLRSL
jgi:CxxC motif-containing protein (DUF1111 family)